MRCHVQTLTANLFRDFKTNDCPLVVVQSEHRYKLGDIVTLVELDVTTGELTGDGFIRQVFYVSEPGAKGIEPGWVVLQLHDTLSQGVE